MEKIYSLLLISLASIVAAPSYASTVNLYGAIDLGLKYQKSKGHDAVVSMDSGTYAGSRWGLNGREELTNDLSVSFMLGNQALTQITVPVKESSLIAEVY